MAGYNFIRVSGNAKTGPIPQTYSDRSTCPDACAFKGAGCYAEGGNTRMHWDKNTNKSWETMIAGIRLLPKRQLWRHNVAGDLPGENNRIDVRLLAELVEANRGKGGFTFTHKPVDLDNWRVNAQAVYAANKSGFTINLSADSLADADRKASLGIGPVVVVLPEDAPDKQKTPEGRSVIVCPAQRKELDMQCDRCQLCAKTERKAIIGFRAHGAGKKKVSLRVVQ